MEIPGSDLRASVTPAWTDLLGRSVRRAAVVWSVVLTVLVCAIAPEGLPQTASQGSAFNPATTSVALNARSPRERADAKRLLPPGKADTDRDLPLKAAVLPAAPRLVRAAPATAPLVGSGSADLHADTLASLPWARAPPVS